MRKGKFPLTPPIFDSNGFSLCVRDWQKSYTIYIHNDTIYAFGKYFMCFIYKTHSPVNTLEPHSVVCTHDWPLLSLDPNHGWKSVAPKKRAFRPPVPPHPENEKPNRQPAGRPLNCILQLFDHLNGLMVVGFCARGSAEQSNRLTSGPQLLESSSRSPPLHFRTQIRPTFRYKIKSARGAGKRGILFRFRRLRRG